MIRSTIIFVISSSHLISNLDGAPVISGLKPPSLDSPTALEGFNKDDIPCTANATTSPFQSRNGLINRNYRWKEINIFIDPDFSDEEKRLINDGMWFISSEIPCLPFRIHSSIPDGDYIYVRKGFNDGCWSYVGRRGGKQVINLQSPGCMSLGIIMHEMLHAIGFYHEQSRTDRDENVEIHLENIIPGQEYNFRKYSSLKVTAFDVPYNTHSIMHYSSHAFSKNGKPTITEKMLGKIIPWNERLAETDKMKLREMYNCELALNEMELNSSELDDMSPEILNALSKDEDKLKERKPPGMENAYIYIYGVFASVLLMVAAFALAMIFTRKNGKVKKSMGRDDRETKYVFVDSVTFARNDY